MILINVYVMYTEWKELLMSWRRRKSGALRIKASLIKCILSSGGPQVHDYSTPIHLPEIFQCHFSAVELYHLKFWLHGCPGL